MDEFFKEMQQKGLIEFKKPQSEYERLYGSTKNFEVKIEQTDTIQRTNFEVETQCTN